MNAQELISLLEKYPSETKIVVRGYEDGYNDIDELKHRKIMHQPKAKWYYGEYADSDVPNAIEAIELFGENKNEED